MMNIHKLLLLTFVGPPAKRFGVIEHSVSPGVDGIDTDRWDVEEEQDYYMLNPEMASLPRPSRTKQAPARYQ